MKKENIYNAIFILLNVPMLLLMIKADELLRTIWEKILDGAPLPGLTEMVMNMSPYWPILFMVIFAVNMVIAIKSERLAFHILMLSIIIEIIILLIIYTSYLVPFISIGNESAN